MRTVDRVLALLFGLAGLIGGVLVVVEILYRSLGNPGHLLVAWDTLSRYLRQTSWSAGAVIATGVLLALVGLTLVLAELKPRRPALLVLGPVHPDVTAALPRRSVARLLDAAVGDTPGVESGSVAVRARSVKVSVRSTVRDDVELQEKVRRTAQASLDALDLRRTPRLDVTVGNA